MGCRKVRRDSNQQKIAIAVGIALSAGMFSIVPVAYGAPVGGTVTTGGASIAYSDAANGGKDTSITSTTMNNVIDWQDFSVAKGEKVVFDGGTKDPTQGAHNYMNIVSGMNTSQIDGAIKGGNEVYIINPNGVIFGETASVDVGSLYASTRYVSSAAAVAAATAGDMTTVLADTSAGVATDVVNLGTINATNVVMEGQNVRFVNDSTQTNDGGTNVADYKTTGVKASSVVLKADTADGGYIHVGNANGSNTGYTGESLTDGNDFSPVYYKLIGNSNWSEITSSGNFMLKEDITADNFTQIADFSGKFDGNFYEIKGISGVSGVFAKTTGTATNKAEIYNLGVTEATISADVDAGAIVADATYTVLKNVYNNGSSVSGVNVGGLVGNAKGGVEISNSYNTGNLGTTSDAAGFIGIVSSGTNSIEDSYSTGTARYGISFEISADATLNVARVHTKGSSYFSQTRGIANVTNLLMQMNNGKFIIYPDKTTAASDVDNTAIATYQSDRIAWGTAISNTGGVSIDTNRYVLDSDGNPTETINTNYGKVTRPTWRIYEGKSTPMLTSQFKGIKATVYDYGYFKANGTLDSEAAKYNNGANGGKDMPAYTGVENNLPNGLVYNGEYLKIVSNVTNEDGSVTTTAATSTDGKLADVSLAFNTNGLSTIDGSHILYDAAGRKDATFTKEANSQTEGTQNVLALLYSDQTGYDLVGNNIAIAPRKVSVSTDDIGSVTIVKEYDGTSTANSAVTDSLFSGDSSTVTGILDGDDASVSFAGTATFTNNGAAAKAVGVYTYDTTQYNYTTDSSNPPPAYVNLDGTITLTDTTNNYLLDGDGSLKGWAQGAITQKAITVSLNGGPYTKTYDKNAIAKGVAADDFNFATDAIITTGEGSSEVSEDVALAFADKAYFVNADDNESSSAGDYTNRVRFGGLQLSGNDKGNYKLVDSEGNVLYSYSKLITTSTDLQGNVTITQAESGVNTDNGGALYASGSIDKRNISSKNFEWYTGTEDNKNWFGGDTSATRPYSGSAVYTEPVGFNVSNERSSDGNSGMLAGDSLTFAVQSARFVTSDAWDSSGTEGTGTHLYNSTKNVADAQGVVYTVSITGDAAGNYTLDGESINTTTGGTNTVIGAGTITPRTLNLIVNANADMDKVYDGNAYVTGATENNPAYLTDAVLGGDTGFLKYQDTDADHHFLGDDANAKIKVVGTYQVTGNDYSEARNVNYDAANNTALAKDIVYEAAVMEGDAESSNYKFAIINTGNTVVEATNTDATKADFKGTDAQGIINQREIDKIVFADVEKTYDGSSAVTNTTNNGDDVTFKTNDRITITGLQLDGDNALSAAGEAISDVFDVDANGQIAAGTDNALISGVYGEGTDWQANEHASDNKVVHYTISDDLWKNHNYKLTADAKFEGNGKINKLAIAPDDIKLERNSTVITKVYNGDDDVATVADTVGNVNRSVTDYLTQRQAYVSKDGHELDIAVSVDGANYETSHHTNDSGSTDLTVNYTVSLVNATDYTIKDTNGDSVTQITRDEDANGHKITGTISARPITVTTADIVNNNVENGGLTKVYDATANANGSGESLVSGINSQILSADQTGGVANATTGTYNNKHANSNDTANLDANGLKTVTYALQLDHNDYGDYKFVDANGSDISQIEGKGTIKKRSLTLTTTVHPEKTYSNGSPEVETDDMPTADDINFGSTENNNVVALDGFTASALTGAYQITGTEENAGDVNRAADRSVLDKNIIYSGVLAALGTENAGNYEVEDTFTGTGRIDPNTINYLDFQFVLQDNIRQTYSGNNTVGEYGMEGDALTNFQKGWIDKDNSGIKIGNDLITLANGAYGISSIEYARFDNANANTGKTVEYRIHVNPDSLQNYDYEKTYTDNNGTHTVEKDSIYLNAEKNNGIIEKRAVVASVTHDKLEKYYDGTENIYNGDNAAYSGAASGTELSGADAVTFAAVVADGTTTQTGLIDGTNESTGAYDGAGVGKNNKTINYTAKVDDTHSGNYKFVDAAGNELTNGQGTALTTTQNTINPFGVVLTTADTTKTYDGTKGVTAAKATAALQLGNNYDNLQLTDVTDDTGVYDNPNVQNGAAHTVTYTGFALNNDNYYLAKADGSAIDTDSAGNNVITGKGYITKYTLTDLPTFTIHDVTKEYDTDALVKYNRSSNADDIKRNFITATNLPGDIAYEVVKAEYTDSARGVGKTVNFTLQLSSDNYNFDSLVNEGLMNADGTFAESSTGDITPRKVYVSLDTTPEIKKTYDGDAGVEQDVTNMIIVRDGDLLNDGTSLNRDASVIHAQYDTKDAGDDKTVTYQVRLTGNGADNYEIHRLENLGNDTADIVYSTLEGRGKIDKATLTFNPDDHAFDRDYRKGDANVGLNAGSVVLTGVNGETVTLNDGALNKVTAEFGKGTGANDFTADENVSWNGDNVVDKDIRFTGLDNALQYMVDNNVDTISKNYTIDGTAYFAAAKAKGKIKPITITQAATENWKAVTREYNADTDLQEVYDYSGSTAEPLGINDILTFTLTHDGNTVTDSNGNALTVTYTAVGKYDDQNVGDNHTLNYHINSVETKVKDAASNANYILDDSVLTALVNHDVDSGAANNAGNAAVYSHITPRQLNAAVVKDSGNRKIYDGNDRADTSNFVVDADDQAILSKDGLLNDVVITARYGDKHASVNPREADSNSKTITYTLALNDNSGNYAIATPSAAAQGDIERRKVYVDGTNAVAAPKDYDGNTDLPSGTDYNAMGFGLRDADSTTGLVTGDSDLKLDATQVEGHYVSPDVKRAADGSVIAQNINFSGFKLNDTDSTNDNSINDYVVIDAGGSGVIKPLPVSVSIAAAPYKVYDGTTTVKGTAAANANLVPSGLLTGDSANILIGSADYDDASAGTNKGYTYNITLGNGNYTLVQGSNAPDITVTGNGLKGQIKASDGTIDKRTITPTVNGIMTKVYDGTTAGTENAAANISLGNVLSGENVGLTAKAVYDNPNAGKSEDSDELQNHRVTYTLNLSNPNYQLADDTVTGTGTISRKGLNIVATPVSINNGEAMPKFSGTVEGLVSGDENLTSSFVFDTLPTVTNVSVGSNPVYGWYRNSYDDGNLGLNYTYQQDPANAAAFTVNYVDSGRNNPDTKITPTNNIYQQISKDKGSGFGDNAAAALEYVDKNGQVIARETIDSGEIHDGSVSLGNADDMTSQDTSLANIGIVGGDIVNVDGADAANMANIEVTDNGTTVNLEITSLSSGESGDKQAVAEITSVPAAADNSSAQIQNLDDRQDILEQITNKEEEQEKEGEIAIESKSSQNDDEIELTVEGNGVNVA